jgi:hypothetical protein
LPDELPFWQLSAGFIAGLLALLVVFAFVRSRSPVILVAVGLLIAVPLAGFVVYAISPLPPRFGGWPLTVAVAGALVGSVGAVVMLRTAVARRGASLSASTARILSIAIVTLWTGIVIAMSGFLAQWEPAFAVANLVVNAAWAVLWLPSGTRRLQTKSSFEVAAPRSRVFEFLSAPEKQKLYDEDVVSVTTDPPGELAVGSRITVVRRYDSAVRGPRMLPGTVEVTAVVTDLATDTSITSAGRAAVTTFDFADSPNGTVVSTTVTTTVPYRLAFLGAMVALAMRRGAERARRDRSVARLKALLEQP